MTEKNSPVNFATIGTSWITDSFITAARQDARFNLAAVFSREKSAAENFARKHGAPNFFTDFEQLTQSPVIDAVYIASPNALHFEQTRALLNAGKHVLCEKSLATNAREVAELFQCAQKNKRVLMEAMIPTLLPSVRMLPELIKKIGTVRRFQGSFCKYSSRYDEYRAGKLPNIFNPRLAGGSLMDLGVYTIYVLVALFGMPKKILANAVMLPTPEGPIDGSVSVLGHYPTMEAVLMASKIATAHSHFEIQGEEGTILIQDLSTWAYTKILFRDGRVEEIKIPEQSPGMFYELQEFINVVQSGQLESKINTAELACQVAEFMDEVRAQIGLNFPK